MRIVAQRVTRASVTVKGELVSQIDRGIMALVGVFNTDTMEIAEAMASKLAKVRIFEGPEDEGSVEGRWRQNVMEMGGSILCVSQFTLCANLKKGSKPDFHAAMPGEESRKVFDYFCEYLGKLLGSSDRVKKGQFGTRMLVELVNDGPVTIVFDSAAPQPEKERHGSKPKPKQAQPQQQDDSQLAKQAEQSLSCKDDKKEEEA